VDVFKAATRFAPSATVYEKSGEERGRERDVSKYA